MEILALRAMPVQGHHLDDAKSEGLLKSCPCPSWPNKGEHGKADTTSPTLPRNPQEENEPFWTEGGNSMPLSGWLLAHQGSN